MTYAEKDFQRELRHKHGETSTFASEQKISKKKSIRFDAVQPHQLQFLDEVKSGIFFYKFNDFYIKNQTLKKPFDSLCLINEPAYIIVMFYIPRKKKNVYWIDIDIWKQNEYFFGEKGRHSIKETELEEISYKVQNFLK